MYCSSCNKYKIGQEGAVVSFNFCDWPVCYSCFKQFEDIKRDLQLRLTHDPNRNLSSLLYFPSIHTEDCAADRTETCEPPPGLCNCRASQYDMISFCTVPRVFDLDIKQMPTFLGKIAREITHEKST